MPSHNAGYREAEQVLVKFFRETSGESYDEALTLAELFAVNGEVMYSTSEQQLIDVYGVKGGGLYTIVQHSPYSRVCLFLVLRIQFLKINAVKFYNFWNAQFGLFATHLSQVHALASRFGEEQPTMPVSLPRREACSTPSCLQDHSSAAVTSLSRTPDAPSEPRRINEELRHRHPGGTVSVASSV